MLERRHPYVILGLALLVAASLTACSGGSQTPPQSSTPTAESTESALTSQTPGELTEPPTTAEPSSTDTFPAGTKDTTKLVTKDLVVGTGAVATPGKTVTVQYTGWLVDGKKFDSSRDSGKPFTFALGQGQVIKGWDQGVAGMKVGGKRLLVIPPDLGYGAAGAGGVIPPNATLVFAVELIGVQ